MVVHIFIIPVFLLLPHNHIQFGLLIHFPWWLNNGLDGDWSTQYKQNPRDGQITTDFTHLIVLKSLFSSPLSIWTLLRPPFRVPWCLHVRLSSPQCKCCCCVSCCGNCCTWVSPVLNANGSACGLSVESDHLSPRRLDYRQTGHRADADGRTGGILLILIFFGSHGELIPTFFTLPSGTLSPFTIIIQLEWKGWLNWIIWRRIKTNRQNKHLLIRCPIVTCIDWPLIFHSMDISSVVW